MVAARHEWQAGMALGSAGLLAAVLAVVVAQMVRPWGDIWDGDGKRAAFNIVLAVLMAPCALATARRKTDGTDAVMGDQSYLVYILHWPFVTLLRAWAPGLWGFVAGAGVLVALCLAAWRWVDRPLEGVRRAWVAGRGRAGEAGETAKKDDSAAILA